MRKSSDKTKVLLTLILVFGFLVRIWGIDLGLPYLYQADEGKILYTTFYSAANWLRPDIYTHSIYKLNL